MTRPKTKTAAKPAAKKAPAKKAGIVHDPAAMAVVARCMSEAARPSRPKYLPRGMIWCGKCLALASSEGSETTLHGFSFCFAHKAKP